MSGGLVLAIESSCDETGIALIGDGRLIHANVVASQVALHAPTGGIVPEVAARAHLRWIVPGPRRGVGRRRRDLGRHRRDRGDLRTGPGRLAAGRHQLRQGARLGPRRAARRGQPPRGPRLCRVAARSRSRRTDPDPVFPLVALVVSGGPYLPRRDARPPDLSTPRHDPRRRRRRGLRQGRPAARPGLPGRTGDRSRRRGRDAARPRLPAGMAGQFVRPQLLRAQDGRAPDHRGSSVGCRAGHDPGRAVARRHRRRARVGLPGRGRRRPRHEDDPGCHSGRRLLDRGRRRRGGQRAPCAPGWPAKPRRSGCRSSCRARRCAPTTGR